MQRTELNPPSLINPTSRGYQHVVVIREPGSLVFISGQGPLDSEMNLVGADMATQAAATFANVKHALASAGAEPRDVVKIVTYVVDISQQGVVRDERIAFFGDATPSASTMVEVSRLPIEGMLIEVEAIAAIR